MSIIAVPAHGNLGVRTVPTHDPPVPLHVRSVRTHTPAVVDLHSHLRSVPTHGIAVPTHVYAGSYIWGWRFRRFAGSCLGDNRSRPPIDSIRDNPT